MKDNWMRLLWFGIIKISVKRKVWNKIEWFIQFTKIHDRTRIRLKLCFNVMKWEITHNYPIHVFNDVYVCIYFDDVELFYLPRIQNTCSVNILITMRKIIYQNIFGAHYANKMLTRAANVACLNMFSEISTTVFSNYWFSCCKKLARGQKV